MSKCLFSARARGVSRFVCDSFRGVVLKLGGNATNAAIGPKPKYEARTHDDGINSREMPKEVFVLSASVQRHSAIVKRGIHLHTPPRR